MKPTFGSLFAGVGGFDMGMEQAGWDCLFQVEWDKNCQHILNRHWPDVPKWGDVSTVSGTEIPPVDCIIFGSPCQDLSVAGKRAGLEGERSGLFYEAVRIIKEMRDVTNGAFPRWAIWENVAGALSSNSGRDFATVINEMAEAGAVLQEFAVLDAQHFGVPQRRRRVFLVACFDPATAFNCPDPLLPVSESVRGDSAKGKSKRQTASRTLTEGVGGDGAWWDGRDTAEAITTTSNEQRMPDKNRFQAVIEQKTFTGSSFAQYTEGVGTLRSNGGDLGGGPETVVVEPYVKSRRAQSSTDDETWVEGEINPTLNSFDMGDTRATTAIIEPVPTQKLSDWSLVPVGVEWFSDAGVPWDGQPMLLDDTRATTAIVGSVEMVNRPVKDPVGTLQARVAATNHESIRDGHAIVEEPILLDGRRVDDVRVYDPPVQTLQARMGTGGNNVPVIGTEAVAYSIREDAKANTSSATELDHANALSALRPSPQSHHAQMFIAQPMAVRRLTPLECERLMGWPDDHTRWKADGSEQADTHRYKQCGNGVATPVARWIAEHILKANQ